MSLDERALAELTEESQDLHSDAMRRTVASLDGLVDEGRQARAGKSWSLEQAISEPSRNSVVGPVAVAGGILAATGFAAALAALAACELPQAERKPAVTKRSPRHPAQRDRLR